ncbi:Alpha-D-kanosaminyltransferase [Planctomycetes bacterium Poly30]|uniref:Alpha-D-kanosaminyltransferase n=1 Tax=Saltatorellus ferox TaxID=2528018 RepID=A0A518EM02_9BACT|nr:Alpha-D-kanosaminyltransferase [Planctomycetes bacterium Poly30]
MAPKASPRDAVKLRVLASAYACEPGLGSEPGIGWNWARQIALHHELTLITRENNVAAIRKRATAEDLRIEVIGHDLSDAMLRWKKGARRAMPYYYLWQKSLGHLCESLGAKDRFDVAHHLTFASGWIPSGLAEAGLPFVFGPVGQHPKIPAGFQAHRELLGRTREALRDGVRRLVPTVDRSVESTWEEADVILSLGRAFGDRLPPHLRERTRPMLACGIDGSQVREPVPRAPEDPMRVLFCGRLVELKGVHLALEAFALAAREAHMTLEIVGEGPERPRLEASIRRLGLEDRVTLRGHLTHEESFEAMRAAHVFLFPSFEGAGMVVPEAMSAGAAVLCLDYGGPGEMCAHGRGLAIPLESSMRETASELSFQLRRLHGDDSLRLSVAEIGQEWSRRSATWASKGAALGDIYRTAIQNRKARGRQRAA